MSQVIRTYDKTELIPTRLFPYAKFPFPNFNPVQSGLFGVVDRDANHCLATSTSSGKTVCGEMMLSYAIREKKKKGMYVVPYRSIAQEKIDDWTSSSHHFSDLNISICTGDYVLTQDRQKELNNADLIIITTEMLASQCRNMKLGKKDFLYNIGECVVDESHLLGIPVRGAHLEVAIMKLALLNPDARFTLLSATMPNVDEVCGWLSHITRRNTFFLESAYRPCQLNIHYVEYFDGNRCYDDTEGEKVATALDIVRYYPKDKFLIFAHTKGTGNLMIEALKKQGIHSEFHNASLTKEKRVSLENRFRKDPDFRVVVATSTLSTGINMPARRVIILGVHRGLTEVSPNDIIQSCGRSGRVGLDPQGDAYILLPETEEKFEYHKNRLRTPQRIESQVLEYIGSKDDRKRDYKILAFHLVSEIHHRTVKTKKDMYSWYSKSFAHYQAKDIDEEIVDNVVKLLTNCGAIKEENGEYVTTPIGTIASMFYFSPFDISDYKRQFANLFSKDFDTNDFAIAVALGNTDSNRLGIVSRVEKEEMSGFTEKVQKLFGMNAIIDPAIKASYCYYLLLSGKFNPVFDGIMRNYQADFPRIAQLLMAMDHMACKWDRYQWFKTLRTRIQYGVKPELVDLCQLPNIGGVRAKKLWDNKIRTVQDLFINSEKVKQLTKLSEQKMEELLNSAKTVLMEDRLGFVD